MPNIKAKLSGFVITLFALLFIIGFMEMLFYFIYIYLPLERISGKNIGVPEDLPTISSILNPGIIIDESISLEDTKKVFYFDKFDDFKYNLAAFEDRTQFIRTADLSYVVSGVVSDVQKFSESEMNRNFSVLLRDSAGAEITVDFTKAETEEAQISLISYFPSFSKTKGILDVVRPGDFLIIKRSISVLDAIGPNNVEIEVYLKQR